uniref:Peptidase_M1 domain-containing protein n=1 Tax=Heterorhabditis bacteriophora TaxID=37862 RepID=A0A1I7XHR5_HETBA
MHDNHPSQMLVTRGHNVSMYSMVYKPLGPMAEGVHNLETALPDGAYTDDQNMTAKVFWFEEMAPEMFVVPHEIGVQYLNHSLKDGYDMFVYNPQDFWLRLIAIRDVLVEQISVRILSDQWMITAGKLLGVDVSFNKLYESSFVSFIDYPSRYGYPIPRSVDLVYIGEHCKSDFYIRDSTESIDRLQDYMDLYGSNVQPTLPGSRHRSSGPRRLLDRKGDET